MNFKNFFSRKKYLEDFWKKYRKIFIAFLIVFLVWFIYQNFGPKAKYIKHSPFCQNDSECELYNCSLCGNKIWIRENQDQIKPCDKDLPGLIGCACVEGQCKRTYKK